MIKVSVLKDKDNYKNIEVTGHALYDDFGKDIVCASTSSIIITSINACIKINEESIKYDYTKDGIKIDIHSNDEIIQKLMDNMIKLLEELSEDYPKNIIVR